MRQPIKDWEPEKSDRMVYYRVGEPKTNRFVWRGLNVILSMVTDRNNKNRISVTLGYTLPGGKGYTSYGTTCDSPSSVYRFIKETKIKARTQVSEMLSDVARRHATEISDMCYLLKQVSK